MADHTATAADFSGARMRVLEIIEQSLQQTLALTDEARAAQPPDSPPTIDRESKVSELLARLDSRLAQLRASVAQAEQQSGAVDAVLASGAEEAGRWLAKATEWKQRVAKEIPLSL
jgi:hypothetical protein